MVTIIPGRVEKIWEIWDVRCAVLLSFFIQVFLVLFAPFRKSSDSMLLGFSIWCVYLLADWAANFSLGLISTNNGNGAAKDNLMALWSPFLLLHFGGVDTITAFSLEDNQLWLRQVPGLLFKVATSAYVFVLTLPQNTLWIPTLLIFVAGIIKCFERTFVLYIANYKISREQFDELISFDEDAKEEKLVILMKIRQHAKAIKAAYRFKNSMTEAGIPTPESSPDKSLKDQFFIYEKPLEQELWEYCFIKNFIDLAIKDNVTADEALGAIEVLMEFIYEMYYTKAPIFYNKVACLVLHFIAFSSVAVGLGLFTSMGKNALDKFDKIDIAVAYGLLYGALSIETISLLRLIFSEHNSYINHLPKLFQVNVIQIVLSLQRPRWSPCKKMPYTQFQALSTPLLFRRWCGSISGHNLITICLGERRHILPPFLRFPAYPDLQFKSKKFLERVLNRIAHYLGAKELLKLLKYKVKSALLLQMWEFVFYELRATIRLVDDKTLEQRICLALNQQAELNQESIANLLNVMLKSNDEEDHDYAFDRILMLLHVTTDLCYADEPSDGAHQQRHFIKLLSDYMLYLLLMQPNMMPDVPGIGQGWFRCTYKEAISFVEKEDLNPRDHEIEKRVCRRLLAGFQRNEIRKPLLFHACQLAEYLKNQFQDKKWEVIGIIWVQMLLFAAVKCKRINHVQQLSKGGELISLVWLSTFIVKGGDIASLFYA